MLLGPLGPVAARYPWCLLLLFAAIAFITGSAQSRIAKARLLTRATPKNPILEWEKAGTETRMKEILAAWDEIEARPWANRTLIWDFFFLASYGAGLSLACSMGARFFQGTHAPWGEGIFVLAAWAAIGAALLDLAENLYLARMLRPFDGETLPRRMHVVSRLKWGIVGGVLPLALVGILIDLFGSRPPS